MKKLMMIGMMLALSACSGMKVVKPTEPNKNAGTKQLDLSGGTIKFVSTYTCNLESTGNHFSAVGKTEAETRKEVLARCRDKTIISFCKEDKITCIKN